MYEALMFLTDNFEEMEAIVPADILRRGGVELVTVSLRDENTVRGSHGIPVMTDAVYGDIYEIGDASEAGKIKYIPGKGMLILPGGPGTVNYKEHAWLPALLEKHHRAGGKLAAICAAPSVLGGLGILEGKKAVCYPGYEGELKGAVISENAVETDGNVTTSRSAATAFEFGFELLKILKGADVAEKVRASMPC